MASPSLASLSGGVFVFFRAPGACVYVNTGFFHDFVCPRFGEGKLPFSVRFLKSFSSWALGLLCYIRELEKRLCRECVFRAAVSILPIKVAFDANAVGSCYGYAELYVLVSEPKLSARESPTFCWESVCWGMLRQR